MSLDRLLGSRLGPFELRKLLGSGAASRVYLGVHHSRPDFRVAVKALPRRPRDAAALCREVAVLKALRHPGVVRLLDLRESAHHTFLITEYVPGDTLFRLLDEASAAAGPGAGPCGVRTPVLRRVLAAVADALLHAKGLGIAHRDIKVENVLVSNDCRSVVLGDFGFAAVALGRRHSTKCGSPHYVAPEVISTPSYCAFQADVWSLGATAFALATGCMAFPSNDPAALPHLIVSGSADWASLDRCASPEAADLVRGMLRVDPEARLTLEAVRAHPFLAGVRPTPAPPLPPLPPLPGDAESVDTDAVLSLCDLGLARDGSEAVRLLREPRLGIERGIYALVAGHHLEHEQNALLATPPPSPRDSSVGGKRSMGSALRYADPDDVIGEEELLAASHAVPPRASAFARSQ